MEEQTEEQFKYLASLTVWDNTTDETKTYRKLFNSYASIETIYIWASTKVGGDKSEVIEDCLRISKIEV